MLFFICYKKDKKKLIPRKTTKWIREWIYLPVSFLQLFHKLSKVQLLWLQAFQPIENYIKYN